MAYSAGCSMDATHNSSKTHCSWTQPFYLVLEQWMTGTVMQPSRPLKHSSGFDAMAIATWPLTARSWWRCKDALGEPAKHTWGLSFEHLTMLLPLRVLQSPQSNQPNAPVSCIFWPMWLLRYVCGTTPKTCLRIIVLGFKCAYPSYLTLCAIDIIFVWYLTCARRGECITDVMADFSFYVRSEFPILLKYSAKFAQVFPRLVSACDKPQVFR